MAVGLTVGSRMTWKVVPEWLWWVLGGAIVLGLLVMTPTAKQWHATSGLPQETAVVTHMATHRGGGKCDKLPTPPRDIDWRSLTPPRGLPADFGELGACRDVKVGEKVRIVRIVGAGGAAKAEIVTDPPRSFGTVLAAGSIGAVGGAVCGLLLFGLGRFQRSLVRRRIRRQAATRSSGRSG